MLEVDYVGVDVDIGGKGKVEDVDVGGEPLCSKLMAKAKSKMSKSLVNPPCRNVGVDGSNHTDTFAKLLSMMPKLLAKSLAKKLRHY